MGRLLLRATAPAPAYPWVIEKDRLGFTTPNLAGDLAWLLSRGGDGTRASGTVLTGCAGLDRSGSTYPEPAGAVRLVGQLVTLADHDIQYIRSDPYPLQLV